MIDMPLVINLVVQMILQIDFQLFSVWIIVAVVHTLGQMLEELRTEHRRGLQVTSTTTTTSHDITTISTIWIRTRIVLL
jgi:hypothetical protein